MNATLLKTNNGNGVKIVLSGEWLYTSLDNFKEFVEGKRKSLVFSEFKKKA